MVRLIVSSCLIFCLAHARPGFRLLATPPALSLPMSSAPADFATHKLPADRFWAGADINVDPLLKAYLFTHEGVIVDAPEVVPLDLRSTLPVVAIQFGRNSAFTRTPAETHTVIAVADVDRNRVYFTTLERSSPGDGDPDEVAPPEEPSPDSADDRAGRVHPLELRSRCDLPWEPGRLLLTAITRENVSNRSSIVLRYSPAHYVDPEAERVLAARAEKIGPNEVWPPVRDPYPVYGDAAGAPPAPPAPGVALAVPRVWEMGRGLCLVRGSFRLTPKAHEMVKREPRELGGLPADTRRPTAIVEITLLIQGANTGQVSVARLRVPSWDPPAVDGKPQEVVGHFALHLPSLPGFPGGTETLFVTAFSSEHLAGPFPLARVP